MRPANPSEWQYTHFAPEKLTAFKKLSVQKTGKKEKSTNRD